MLQITEFTEAALKLTTRSKTHGDEKVPAVTLKLTLTVANTVLDAIDPTIRESLFKLANGTYDMLNPEHTPVLRCNSIDRVTLATKHEGWTLEVDSGIDETQPKVFGGCKLDKFVLEPKQGGSCVLTFNVGTSDLDEDRAGMLGMHQGQSIWIKLRAPERAADGPADSEDGDEQQEPDATDLFLAGAQDDEPADDGNPFGDNLVQDEAADAPLTAAEVFGTAPSATVVSMKRGRRLGKGLGSDAEQAERQARELAADPTQGAYEEMRGT